MREKRSSNILQRVSYCAEKTFVVLALVFMLSTVMLPTVLVAKQSQSSDKTYKIGIVHDLDPNGDGFLTVRNSPKGKEIDRLYANQIVRILDKKGKWYKIKINGRTGWSHGNWIKSGTITKTERANDVVKEMVHEGEAEGDSMGFKLYGKSDSCTFYVSSNKSLEGCHLKRDAQGAFMLCTPHKEVCKTLGEVFGADLTGFLLD